MAMSSSKAILPTATHETPEQIVFEFFQEGIPITETPRDVALKKSNAVIKTVTPLSLLDHKIIDACIFVARPKVLTQGLHVVDLDYLKWLISFNSKNNEYLKKAFTKIQQTLIQINIIDDKNPEKDLWHSTQLLYDVTITNGKLLFRVPESLQKNIADPKTWTLLSFRIKNKFTSVYAYTLYQRCRLDQFRDTTNWMTVDEFREIMNPGQPGLYTKFQDLQKRVIKPAVEQINEFSDILVTADYKRRGRAITDIRFIIEKNPALDLELDEKDRLPKDIYDSLKAFGLANSQIDEFATTYDIPYLAEKIEFTRFRMTKRGIPRPDKYLLKALEEDLRFTATDLEAIEQQRKATEMAEAKVVVKKESSREADARIAAEMQTIGAFNELDAAGKQAVIEAFKGTEAFATLKKLKLGHDVDLDKPSVVRTRFVEFLQSSQVS